MIYILTSTQTILETQVRPQESKPGDSVAKALLHLKMKQQLTSEAYDEQSEYLSNAAIAAYVSLNGLDQRQRYRASINLSAINSESFNFTQGSSSSGLGYALSLFSSWWTQVLSKPTGLSLPIFATGEVLTSGQINSVSHISDKIQAAFDYVKANQLSFSSFYFCYPQDNERDVTDEHRQMLAEVGGVLVPAARLQSLLGELLGDVYDGDPLGRWEPFKGLKSFEYEDSVRFFGRDQEVERLYEDLQRSNGLLLVTGASGSGKTSLVKAGLIPRLEQERDQLHWAIKTPSEMIDNGSLVEFIVEQLNLAWGLKNRGANLPQLVLLLKSSVSDGVDELQSYLEVGSKDCLFCIDQYETTLSQNDKNNETLAYELHILEVIASELQPVNIVLVLRNEYLGQLFSYQNLALPVVFNLASQLSIASWQAIVHKQASFSGISFELNEINVTLDSVIVEEALSATYSLSMVELLLEQLYVLAAEANVNSRCLSFSDYDLLGGFQGVFVHRARRILKEFNHIEGLEDGFFDLFVGLNLDKEPYAIELNRRESSSIISEDMQKLIDRFVEERLIICSQSENNDELLTFPYDGFFEYWSELQTWISENLAYLVWRNEIDRGFKEWKKYNFELIVSDGDKKSKFDFFREGFNQGIKDVEDDAYLMGAYKISEGLVYLSCERLNALVKKYIKDSILRRIIIIPMVVPCAAVLTYLYRNL